MGFRVLLRRKRNAADLMLMAATEGNRDAEAWLAVRRADGVTDDDLKDWWGRSDRKREKIGREIRAGTNLVYIVRRREGDTDAEAKHHTGRHFVAFGSAETVESGQFKGVDRPLAEELWARVAARFRGDLYFPDLSGYTSANALIRAEMGSDSPSDAPHGV